MIRVHEIFKIGIGPSSSHTVGPMVAANRFLALIKNDLAKVGRIQIELYGSLAATGKGHATDTAILLGLLGFRPTTINTNHAADYIEAIKNNKSLALDYANGNAHTISFDDESDIIWHMDTTLSHHPNGMSIMAFGDDFHVSKTYYSVGGGFVLDETEILQNRPNAGIQDKNPPPFIYHSAEDILQICTKNNISISQMMLTNECHYQEQAEVLKYLDDIWQVMQECVKNGCRRDGILPGGLNVKRRAKDLYEKLTKEYGQAGCEVALYAMDWVDLYALAVNEENASGGRVVTAPTNGAAGIIPAVLHYYRDFIMKQGMGNGNFDETHIKQGVHEFLLTSAAIGALIKQNASISGAEVGCQGEVGSACAMAAAGLAQVMGGTPAQCLNAAEIGLEHNLGLTCDPIAGLVQVPCIERNAMAAIKSINAARLALRGDGTHHVSLDKAILTMKNTGLDMMDKYKETSRGGLAVFADNRITATNIGIAVNIAQC